MTHPDRQHIEETTRTTFDENIARFQRLGVVKVVVRIAPDSCEACRALASTTYLINAVPVLPYSGCTHSLGCRCTVAPAD